ncbi:cytochrome P450 4C1-like isoform X2 [Cimex lectularius]|nr:cytochrome P450 4C1-like isoform X2 [Cimex lectularius]
MTMFLETALLIAGLIFLLWIYTLPDSSMRELGNKIPGPLSLPIIGCIFSTPKNGIEQLQKWGERFQMYGNTVRFWVGNRLYVICRDEGDMEVLLTSKDNITKSPLYMLLHGWLGTGLLTSTGEKWLKRRKAITPAFHFKILEQFEDVFYKNATILVNKLSSFCGKCCDVNPFISDCTLDIICETSMGISVNAQIQKSSYVTALRKMASLITERMQKPWLHLDFLYKLLKSPKEVEDTISILHETTRKVIQDKQKSMQFESKTDEAEEILGFKKKIPLLESLLKQKTVNGIFSTDQDIQEEVDTFMFEGHDTVTSAISFVLKALSKNKPIQDLLYDEMKQIIGDKTRPSHDDLQELKYLDRVIKESLRLYPSVPAIGRYITSEITLKTGYTLPVGTVVLMSIYWLHRNEKNFPNPSEFNPDNFLPEAVANRTPFAYIPFSAGHRNCIGQKFAMMELKSIVTQIVLNYIIEVSKPDVTLQMDIILLSASGHYISLKRREH